MKKEIDPRIKRTYKMLKDSFVSLVVEKGYESVTVQDITERATLNRATFYLHYQDKYDFLQKIVDDLMNDLINTIKATSYSSNPAETFTIRKLQQIKELFFTHIEKNEAFYRVLLLKDEIPGFYPKFFSIIHDCINIDVRAMSANSEHAKFPKEIIVSYIASSSIGVIKWWLENDMPYTSKFMASYLTQLSVQGPFNIAGFNKI